MKKNFSIEIDTEKLSLEELEEVKKEIRTILAKIEYELLQRKILKRKHSPK